LNNLSKAKEKPQVSKRIIVDAELCSGCSICELACSLYHEGVCNPELSRVYIDKKILLLEYKPQLCVQCDWPSCYFECPKSAIEIDSNTGARYINYDKCTGCGKCEEVCPLMPGIKTINFKKIGKKKIYFKCDLCKGRENGPLCVEMCTRNALTYLNGKKG
jgi:Fe-S-cluster-containing hydrogenase component 2